MKITLINDRLTIRAMQVGLIKLLLTLMIATASLPAFSARNHTPGASNNAPSISGTPETLVVAGSSYNFQPTATDTDGDRLRFSISNKPAWASFSSKTGQLYGTPGSVGSYNNIVITVSDKRRASASLPTFSIQVQAASSTSGSTTGGSATSSGTTVPVTSPVTNTVPVISGTPGTSVVAGSTYSFQPAASDADGDTLSFNIANKPSWASFNTSTGRLNGTPTSGQVGTYSGITVTVSDGQDTASLPAFTITVASAPATGSASLSWVAPTTKTDGSPLSLSEIAGFRIYHGTTSNNLTLLHDLSDGSATSYTVTGLESATHYFAVTGYDYNANESAYSSIASKMIP